MSSAVKKGLREGIRSVDQIRMKSYFTRWIDMSGINKTYDGLTDLIPRDQLAFICNRDLELFLREREPKSRE